MIGVPYDCDVRQDEQPKQQHGGCDPTGYRGIDHIGSLELEIPSGFVAIDQLLYIDLKGFRQFFQHVQVRLSAARFPAADRLAGDIELLGQVFLFQVIPDAQAFEVLIK